MIERTKWVRRAALGLVIFCGSAFADPVAQKLGPAANRWYASPESAAKRVPSHALLNQSKVDAAPATESPVKPEFGAIESRVTAKIHVDPGTSLYGVGRTPGPLLRNGQTFDDAPVDTPWVLAVRADGTAFGAFADTTYATGVSLATDIIFTSDDPALPIVVIEGESPRVVVASLNELTGRMEMPPLWALGYQQFSAFNEAQLRNAAKWLKETRIPATALWLSVDPSTWPITYNKEYVPDVKKLVEDLKSDGFRLIGAIGKTVPTSLDSVLLAAARNGSHILKKADGLPYEIELGSDEHFYAIDYSRKETRDWWKGLVASFMEPGLSGITSARWRTGPIPTTVRLEADADLGGPGDAGRYQNVIDTQFARATWDGAGGEAVNRRPFVMIDARAVGSQRFTGALIDWPEKDARWPQLFTAAALNAGMSGQPFVGTLIKPPFQDLGSEPNLCWIGVAATFPMVAGTFFLPGDYSEFPEKASKTLKLALERRMRLTPYLYSLCFRGFFSCEPILQPLFYDDPKNPSLRANESGFLVGEDLLVMPRPAPGQHADVPLEGAWKKLDFGDGDNEFLPDLYLRPGRLLALGPMMRYPGEKPMDPVTLIANPSEAGEATGRLYEDAGEGYEFYRNQARGIGYRVTCEGDAYMVRLSNLDYGLPLPTRKLEIRIMTDSGELTGSGSEKGTVKIEIKPAEKR